MKILWSTSFFILLMLTLMSCGKEQFGTTPQTQESQPNAVLGFQQASCSNRTLVQPQVDILYVVDNSGSTASLREGVRTSIINTASSVSKEFDYRIISTPLIETSAGNQDFQVLPKTAGSLPATIDSTKIISSASQFNFFSTPVYQAEVGLSRIKDFITAHQSDGLFRQGAYLFVVLVSNGRDTEVETVSIGCNGCAPTQNTAKFQARKSELLVLKSYLNSQQFRLFSVTANVKQDNTNCTGAWSSKGSYGAMSQALYDSHSGFAPKAEADHFDICGSGISTVFAEVNSSIKQILVPHVYKYWPITFTETPTGLNTAEIKVYKSSTTSSPALLPSSSWTYISNSSQTSYNTRVLPSPGEPTTARHLIQFTAGNEVTYPDCIQITSTSNPEYFGYVVMAKDPQVSSIVLKINGQEIPQATSSTSPGWWFIDGQQTRNIKIQHNGFSDLPAVLRTGYMVRLNGASNYYKSGDDVKIYYVPKTN
jgi:hypothetical protein